MSIRSVDLQTLIPRSTEAARAQQVREQGPQVTQEQFAQQLRHQVERKSRQVETSPRAEGGRVTEGKKDNKGAKKEKGKPSSRAKAQGGDEESAGQSPAFPSGPGAVGKRLDIRL